MHFKDIIMRKSEMNLCELKYFYENNENISRKRGIFKLFNLQFHRNFGKICITLKKILRKL